MTAAVARPAWRFVGGKTKLLPTLRELAPKTFGRYYEPFFGGGALFWDLAAAGLLGKVFLSDANPVVTRTLAALKDNVGGVILRLERMPSEKHYAAVAKLKPKTGHPSEFDAVEAELAFSEVENYYNAVRKTTTETRAGMSDVEVAAWFLLVNRLGFNGLYRVNKSGGFNVPWGKWKDYGRLPRVCDAPLLRACSETLRQLDAEIAVQDFEEAVSGARGPRTANRVLEDSWCGAGSGAEPQEGDFVYFDPPYVPVSKTADFTSYTQEGFAWEDQVRLRDIALDLKKRGVYVMLSNADVPQVRELYAPELGFVLHEVTAARSVNSKGDGRGKVGEVVIR